MLFASEKFFAYVPRMFDSALCETRHGDGSSFERSSDGRVKHRGGWRHHARVQVLKRLNDVNFDQSTFISTNSRHLSCFLFLRQVTNETPLRNKRETLRGLLTTGGGNRPHTKAKMILASRRWLLR